MKKPDAKTVNRLISIAFVALFALLALTPLVPEAEVGSRMMISALGIDSSGGVVTLTAETAGGNGSETVRGEGARVTDALQDMNERYGRKAELGHCGAIVMGGGMAAEDMEFALMSLLSEAAVGAGCAVVSAEGSAEEFVCAAVRLGEESGDGVTSYIGFADSSSSVSVPTALTALADLKSRSGATALPVFAAEKKQGETADKDSQNSGSDDGGQGSGKSGGETELIPPRVARVGGGTVFDLSEDATVGLMLFSPRALGGLIDAVWRYGGEEYLLQGEIGGKDCGISVSADGGVVRVTMKADVTMRFKDRFIVIERAGGENVLSELTSTLNAAFTETLTRCALAAAESARIEDFLGLRTEFYRSHPREYKETNGDLSSAVTETKIKVEVY